MNRLNRSKTARIHTTAFERRMRREISHTTDPEVRAKLQQELNAHLTATTTKGAIINAIRESIRTGTVCHRLERIFKRMRDAKLRGLLRSFMELLTQARTKIDCEFRGKMIKLCGEIDAHSPV